MAVKKKTPDDASKVNARNARKDARKARNREANEARHKANVAKVADLRIPSRESKHNKTVVSRNNESRTFTVVKRVRPSVLLRSQSREGLITAFEDAAKRSGLAPRELYSTAQHLAEIARQKSGAR